MIPLTCRKGLPYSPQSTLWITPKTLYIKALNHRSQNVLGDAATTRQS